MGQMARCVISHPNGVSDFNSADIGEAAELRSVGLCVIAWMLGGILVLPAVPQRWWDRQQTVLTYEQDTSAMSRVDNWKFCWRIAVDNPLTGVGFEYGTNEMFAKYAPEFLQTYARGLNTHSI